MAEWSADQLTAIAENSDLFVSPLREDGTTYGTLTQTWALVVEGKVYVRAANGLKSRWYQAAIDAAYEAKYPGSSAVAIMQGPGPKSASVRITDSDSPAL